MTALLCAGVSGKELLGLKSIGRRPRWEGKPIEIRCQESGGLSFSLPTTTIGKNVEGGIKFQLIKYLGYFCVTANISVGVILKGNFVNVKRIILIIGAGASHDLHPQFALGPELLQQISDRVTDRTSIHDRYVSKLLLKTKIDYSICWDFVHHIDEYKRNAKYPSIDEFLNEVSSYPEFKNVKKEFLDIGMFSIMVHILGYEAVLLNRDGNNLRSDAWLNTLCDFIDKNNLLDESLPRSVDLKLINFNYDRNLEHYIYNYPRFVGKGTQLKRFIQDSIIHVYGKIGDLEWQDSINYFKYGEPNDNVDKIFSQRDSIKIMFPDRLSENLNEKKAREWIYHEDTKFVCAFGFNFDYLNCKLLNLPNFDISYLANRAPFIANVYPYGDEGFINRRQMAQKIRNIHHNSEITYYTCSDFLVYIFSQFQND